MIKLILNISFLFFLISCGKDGAFVANKKVVYTVEPATTETYEYELRVDGCTTEVQKFETFIEACAGLKNDKLNNNCAQDGREELFNKSICPGEFNAS